MYTAFYGLREKPFALSPDPRFLYLAESHREALAHLLYGLDQGEGFIVVSGEVGTGKTTLCRSLLERLAPHTELAFLFNPSRNAHELLQSINEEFGLPVGGLSRRELLSRLNRFLLEKKREARRVVLIIDEAQNLSARTLEQVRLLSNLETSCSKLIQIVLLGQPELDATLDSEDMRQLCQRVSVRWSLAPLDRSGTLEYVRHRLRVASGAEREIFNPAALREVHRHSGGVPRRINVICDRALLAGYAEQAARIGPALVRRAASEIPRPAGRAHSETPRDRRRQAAALAAVALLALGSWAFWYAESESPLEVVAGHRGRASGSGEIESREATRPEAAGAGTAPVAAAPPRPLGQLRGEETWLAVPGARPPARALSLEAARAPGAEALQASGREKSGAGDFLARLLGDQEVASGRQRALEALLERYGLPGLAGLPETDAAVRARLGELGLVVLDVEPARLRTLEALDRPALLDLRAADGSPRTLALVHLDGDLAELAGLRGPGTLRVTRDALEARWDGAARIVWRPLGSIPSVLRKGERGPGVLWLQSALAELGHFASPPSGLYDATTRAGVQRFQRAHGLRPDGIAGPLTQMALDDALAVEERPSLHSRRRGVAG